MRQTTVFSILISLCVCVFSGCASVAPVSSRVRRLSARGDSEQALKLLEGVSGYGKRNRLLFLLDKGVVLFSTSKYAQSIESFEQAKRIYDELYTYSISKGLASWIWNDQAKDFRGEDFERPFINIFEALNFAALGEIDEALVEARDAGLVLKSFNQHYSADQRNQYRDDAFVRFLMGIFYETSGSNYDLNDAYVSYRKAVDIYQSDFFPHYNVASPSALKENAISLSARIGPEERNRMMKNFPDVSYVSLKERQAQAEVYYVIFHGQVVNKVQSSLFLPGIDGYLTRISFPRYRNSFRPRKMADVAACSKVSGECIRRETEIASDVDSIARQNLEDRKLRIMTKAVLRPAAKQIVFEGLEDEVRDKWGRDAAGAANILGNMYIAYSEQADLRSWHTLPAWISLGKISLEPGVYDLKVEQRIIREGMDLKAGDKKIVFDWVL